jgi:predicted transcriptional regulator
LRYFATGKLPLSASELEGFLSKRAKDSIRELGIASRYEISRNAGLTDSEVGFAISELKRLGIVEENGGSFKII